MADAPRARRGQDSSFVERLHAAASNIGRCPNDAKSADRDDRGAGSLGRIPNRTRLNPPHATSTHAPHPPASRARLARPSRATKSQESVRTTGGLARRGLPGVAGGCWFDHFTLPAWSCLVTLDLSRAVRRSTVASSPVLVGSRGHRETAAGHRSEPTCRGLTFNAFEPRSRSAKCWNYSASCLSMARVISDTALARSTTRLPRNVTGDSPLT